MVAQGLRKLANKVNKDRKLVMKLGIIKVFWIRKIFLAL